MNILSKINPSIKCDLLTKNIKYKLVFDDDMMSNNNISMEDKNNIRLFLNLMKNINNYLSQLKALLFVNDYDKELYHSTVITWYLFSYEAMTEDPEINNNEYLKYNIFHIITQSLLQAQEEKQQAFLTLEEVSFSPS